MTFAKIYFHLILPSFLLVLCERNDPPALIEASGKEQRGVRKRTLGEQSRAHKSPFPWADTQLCMRQSKGSAVLHPHGSEQHLACEVQSSSGLQLEPCCKEEHGAGLLGRPPEPSSSAPGTRQPAKPWLPQQHAWKSSQVWLQAVNWGLESLPSGAQLPPAGQSSLKSARKEVTR